MTCSQSKLGLAIQRTTLAMVRRRNLCRPSATAREVAYLQSRLGLAILSGNNYNSGNDGLTVLYDGLAEPFWRQPLSSPSWARRATLALTTLQFKMGSMNRFGKDIFVGQVGINKQLWHGISTFAFQDVF